MEYNIVDLTEEQMEEIDSMLEEYDDSHICFKLDGTVNIGVFYDGNLIAGAGGCMTAYRIFYVSTVFVDESFRGKGIGKKLMECIENRAASLGANLIRLDTFDWQGVDFYKSIGYEQVGYYKSESDNFSEHFLLKKLPPE